jgi:hypothetical protein
VIPELAALLFAAALGAGLALIADRTSAGTLLAGEAILMGIGALAAILLLFGLAGVPWSRGLLIGTAVLAGGPAWWIARNRLQRWSMPRSPLAIVFDTASAVTLFGYATLSTVAPLWEFDFIGDWGLKGRLYFEAKGFTWSFLDQATAQVLHPDYPALLPLTFDVLALIRGEWNDRALGLVSVALAVGLLLIVRALAVEETGSSDWAAFVTLAMLSFAASPWIGLAEAPLVAFGTAAILLLRSGVESRVTVAALFLGLAASAKNEGLTLIVAIALALFAAGRRRVIPRLWPALALQVPWTIVRWSHHLTTDLAAGSAFSRVVEHLRQPGMLLQALAAFPVGKPLYWGGVILALLLLRLRFLGGERFAILVIVLQLGFYIGAYLSSPYDLHWHLLWSWERLVSHLTPTLTFIVLIRLAGLVRNRQPAGIGTATEPL